MIDFLGSDGELADLIRRFDWSATPLGPIDGWPQCLRTATALLIGSPSPIVMLWGPQGTMIYNDAYAAFAGGRHPRLLGSNVRDGWDEVADFNDHVMRIGLSGGTLSFTDQELFLNRTGKTERIYCNLDYSPVYDEAGKPAGVIAIVIETTATYLVRQRREALMRLADRVRNMDNAPDITFAAAETLGHLLEVGRVGYGTVDVGQERLHIDHDWTREGVISLNSATDLRLHSDFVDDLKRGETIVVSDIRDDPRTERAASGFERYGTRSLVNFPILEHGRLVALFLVNDVEPHDWMADDLVFIREMAERTHIAVERAKTQRALIESVRLLRFLDDLAKATADLSDADEILAVTTRMTGKHLDVSNCAYADMDPDEDGFTVRGDWSEHALPSVVGHYSLTAFGTRAVAYLHAGQALVLHDVAAELPPHESKAFQDLGIAATICVPLIRDGRLTALMAIYDKVPRQWTANDMTILREVAERSWAHIQRVSAEADLRDSALALRELNASLEQRVEERTSQLMIAESALRQSQKMEAVGQLTGGIAHDFNNLLTGIGGSLEVMQMRIAQGRVAETERYFTAALGAVRRAASLTHRLLAFSRRQTLAPKPINVNRLVSDLEELVRRTVGPSVEVEMIGAGGLWMTLVDPNQLENAILNLCINARDAMEDGGRLTIETANTWLDQRTAEERDLPPDQYVRVSITDTGTGMTSEVIDKAFDPFFTTKPIGVGTGLGLSMIYGFARQSGGQARIYSEVGQGTTVSIYLPRHDQNIELEAAENRIEPPDFSGAGEVVLVIDDEPSIRMLVTEALSEAGYTAIEAADGPSGLKILQSGARIDLLVTDVGLPGGMNGRQVAEEARMCRPDLKVLFITGYAENAAIRNGYLDRRMSIVTKPFQIDMLAGKIRDLIKG